MPTNNPLPPKEKNLFNRILKCYEHKQYKNGLKFAKQILSNPKFAEHGETLAMKGLTLNCLGRKEEGYELVKRGLKNDLKSHVCWHVYGLLQRSDKKYDEAIKCYRNALKWDSENMHILRDLSMLQIHLRDLEGYRKTRYSLLQLKPGQRAPWIGYAISNHLLKDYMLAYKVLDEFGKSQQSQEAQYEYSELLLYQNEILREAGHYQQALDHLKQNEKRILDKLALEESRGELCLLLNERDRAEQIFTNLIYRNPEKLSNYEQLERILEPANEAERYEIYQAISERFPRADMPKLKPLSFVTGERFRRLADKTMRRQLSRGVPPLFITFKPCYNDPGKVDIVEDLVKGYLENLSKDPSTFSPDESEEVQPPTVLLWARYFYAQHLDQTKRYEEALAILNLALEHTPTLIELHAAKAKTLKHMGDMEGAVRCMDEAQSLDTADRYINCKCACYMIRNNLMKAAEDCAAKFTRENVSVDEYLREMQCMWYEIECARAHWNADRPGEALKKCHEVDRHFTEIIEDQFDFHQYCMRKMTLRAYSKMLKLEDSIRSHKFYFRAARIAIQVYIELHDEPQLSGDHATTEEESLMSQAELKKLRNKQRRQERKKAAAEEKKKQELEKIAKRKQAAKNQKSAEEVGDVKKEDELQGDKLMSVADPIEQAYRFLIPLELHRADCFETHFFAFQIAERRSRVLVMLRSILRCRKLVSDATVPSMHMCQVRFAKKVSDLGDEVSSTVRDVIERHKSQLLNDIDVTAFNERFLSEHGNSLPHLFTACKAMYHLDNTRKREALELLLNFDKNMKNVEFPVCSSILKAIKAKRDFGAIEGKLVNDFRAKCHDIFPRANIFYKRDVTSIIVNGLPPSSGGEGAPANDSRKTAPPPLPNGMHTDEAHTASAMVEDHCSHDL